MIDNEVPVEIWKYSTKEKLGEYPTIRKALSTYGLSTRVLSKGIYFYISKKKNGDVRTIKCKKLNDKIYIKLWKQN